MKTRILYLFVLAMLAISCNNNKAIQQQKWDEMMVIHDEVMPLDSEIKIRARDIRKQFADSTLNMGTKERMVIAVQRLELADSLMWKWMYGVTPILELQTSNKSHEEIMTYLDAQTVEIANVSKLMKESMKMSEGL